jgi:antitoxin (DNA-binding transcriptional repressor) of toxin-antitoxin stability system
MTTITLEEAQRDLCRAVDRVLHGEGVIITVGDEALRLVRDVPARPPGYFATCYVDSADASWEERICRDSSPVLDP